MTSLLNSCGVGYRFTMSLLMLIPAFGLVAILKFYRYYRKKEWSLITPFNYIIESRRNYVMIFGFGSLASAAVNEVLWKSITDNSVHWFLRPFVTLLLAAQIAMIYFPLFACENPNINLLLTYSLGIIYCILLLVRAFLSTFMWECAGDNFVGHVFFVLPEFLCIFAVLVVYITRVIKRLRNGERKSIPLVASKYNILHVHCIFKERYITVPSNSIMSKLKWKNNKNFRYSSLLLAVLIININYCWESAVFIISLLTLFNADWTSTVTIIIMVSTILTILLTIGQFLRFMVCHRNNLLKAWASRLGKRNVKEILKTEVVIYRNLSFAGMLVAITITTAAVISLFIVGFVTGIYFLVKHLKDFPIHDLFKAMYSLFAIVCIVSVVNMVLVKYLFKDKNWKKEKLPTIKNINGYHIALYFAFFGNLVNGAKSAVIRMLSAGLINLITLSRVDLCIFNPEYLLWFDRVHRSYLSYLQLSAAYENPTMRVFCQILIEQQQDSYVVTRRLNLSRYSTKALNRWHLACMLMKNQSLKDYRKTKICENKYAISTIN